MEDQTLSDNLSQKWRNWREQRREVGRLGSEKESEREAALTYFFALGEAGLPVLYKALRGSVRSACGAAVALDRMEDSMGARRILRRAYEEEWLASGYSHEAEIAFDALSWLNRDTVTREFHRALDAAAIESDLDRVLYLLSIALSAIRLLNRRGVSDNDSLQRGILFGARSLRFLSRNHSVVLALNLTLALRLEAVRGLLPREPDTRLRIFADALQSRDLSVVRAAIGGLRRGGDRRAAAFLHPLAFGGGHPCADLAREAYARLVGSGAEPLTLLRASQEPIQQNELLRPAASATNPHDREELLRSTA